MDRLPHDKHVEGEPPTTLKYVRAPASSFVVPSCVIAARTAQSNIRTVIRDAYAMRKTVLVYHRHVSIPDCMGCCGKDRLATSEAAPTWTLRWSTTAPVSSICSDLGRFTQVQGRQPHCSVWDANHPDSHVSTMRTSSVWRLCPHACMRSTLFR
jgi:hypothetical protein